MYCVTALCCLHCCCCFSVEGGELIESILKSDCLTEGVIVNYLKQLLNALEYIHEKKIIHCDIKVNRVYCKLFSSH